MSLSAEPTPPKGGELTPIQKEIAYARILGAAIRHEDIGVEKATLKRYFNCSASALDGVHAQFTKDVNGTSVAAGTDGYGDGLNALRLAVRGARQRAQPSDDELPMLEGLETLIVKFEPVARKRGAEIVFKTLVPERFRSSLPTSEAGERAEYVDIADAEFDFPAKRIWRGHWRLKLTEDLRTVTPDRRAQMRVLCFAGTDPTLELSIYQDLGFSAENVFAIESNERAAALLRANLLKLGGWYARVTVIEQDLESYLKKRPGDFHVASLDYHGCFGKNKLRIAEIIPLADHATVLVNLEAGREKHEAQKGMEGVVVQSLLMKQNPGTSFVLDRLLGNLPVTREGIAELTDSEVLKEARDQFVDWELLSEMGNVIWRSPPTLAGKVEQLRESAGRLLCRELDVRKASPVQIDDFLTSRLVSLVVSAVASTCVEGEDPAQKDHVSTLFKSALRGAPLLHDMRRFVYRSAASDTGQSYYSTFATAVRSNYNCDSLAFFIDSLQFSVDRQLNYNPVSTGFTAGEFAYDRKTAIRIMERALQKGEKPLTKHVQRMLERQISAKYHDLTTIAWYEQPTLGPAKVIPEAPMIPVVIFLADVIRLNTIVGKSPLSTPEYMKVSQKRTVITG